MSSPITIDLTKRDKPCHADCRHPLCNHFRKAQEEAMDRKKVTVSMPLDEFESLSKGASVARDHWEQVEKLEGEIKQAKTRLAELEGDPYPRSTDEGLLNPEEVKERETWENRALLRWLSFINGDWTPPVTIAGVQVGSLPDEEPVANVSTLEELNEPDPDIDF